MTRRPRIGELAVLLLLAVGAGLHFGIQAGELEPPGPPGPTMKPLSELEPRIPIYAEQLPLTITGPGSYYLMENISTSGGGITIESSDVTIDLNGFTLAGGTGTGIYVPPALAHNENIIVRNGGVTGWEADGIYLGGIYSTVEDVTSYENGGTGIYIRGGSRVSRCVASFNSGQGIQADSSGNLVEDSIAHDNDENGIDAHQGTTVRGCVSAHNFKNGIRISHYGLVVGNECQSNGQATEAKAGILVLSTDNRIDGNHLASNGVGIQVDAPDNVIIRNTLLGNTTRDIIAAGNDVGPWGTAATATSPWANIWKP